MLLLVTNINTCNIHKHSLQVIVTAGKVSAITTRVYEAVFVYIS